MTTAAPPALVERAPEDRADLAPLFADLAWPRPIVDAALEGVIGTAAVDAGEPPAVAALIAQDFTLVGGDAQAPGAAALVDDLAPGRLVIGSAPWYDLLKERRDRAPESWYWRTFGCAGLDATHLRQLAEAAHAAYDVVPLDAVLAARAWTDLGGASPEHAFRCDADLLADGFGYCAVREGQVVSAGLTFARCGNAIEIQTHTHRHHLRRGLAAASCAALVLRALEEGLEPHWSAANRRSEGLAEKLGFIPESRREVLYLPR